MLIAPDVTIPVTTSMFVNNLVFILACSVHSSSEDCTASYSNKPPVITVANSTHLRINWENSFLKECDDIEAISASLKIQHIDTNTYNVKRIPVNFADKKVDVEADPCLIHDYISIRVELQNPKRYVSSSDAHYNAMYTCNNIKPQDLYSGLLQEQVLDRICKKENGEFLIPDIPKEIQDCVQKTSVDEASSKLSFDIVSPCTKDKLVVESDLREFKCPAVVNQPGKL